MIFDRDVPRNLRSEIVMYLPSIWGFALAISGKPDIADDLTQATCLCALEKQHQFKRDRPAIVWLIAICRSIWLNERRAETILQAGELDAVANLPDLRENPETSVFACQVYERIMALPEAQRAAVDLVYVQQFTYSEAATMLDVPIGTIMSRLSTARNALASLNAAEDRRPVRLRSN